MSSMMMNILYNQEVERTKVETDRVNALKRKEAEEADALKMRNKNMQGGGRTGLMFGGNERGVV